MHGVARHVVVELVGDIADERHPATFTFVNASWVSEDRLEEQRLERPRDQYLLGAAFRLIEDEAPISVARGKTREVHGIGVRVAPSRLAPEVQGACHLRRRVLGASDTGGAEGTPVLFIDFRLLQPVLAHAFQQLSALAGLGAPHQMGMLREAREQPRRGVQLAVARLVLVVVRHEGALADGPEAERERVETALAIVAAGASIELFDPLA